MTTEQRLERLEEEYARLADFTGIDIGRREPKKEEVPPPGILTLIDEAGHKSNFMDTEERNYNDWYKTFKKWKVATICVDGVEWSVGEEVDFYHPDQPKESEIKKIILFEYCIRIFPEPCWTCKFEGQSTEDYSGFVVTKWCHKKRSAKVPVCELPDEEGKMIPRHSQDKFWIVSDWKISMYLIKEAQYKSEENYQCFATRAAAEKYIKENKPIYPQSLVNELIHHVEKLQDFVRHADYLDINNAIEKINQFNNK